jgi:hypothetical protein
MKQDRLEIEMRGKGRLQNCTLMLPSTEEAAALISKPPIGIRPDRMIQATRTPPALGRTW